MVAQHSFFQPLCLYTDLVSVKILTVGTEHNITQFVISLNSAHKLVKQASFCEKVYQCYSSSVMPKMILLIFSF